MQEQLDRLVREAASLQNRFVLVTGTANERLTTLQNLASTHGSEVLNLGLDFSRRLSSVPKRQRQLQAAGILRELSTEASGTLLIFDQVEVLFDRTLQLDPLDLMKRQSHGRTVVASWPGFHRDGRLIYADTGHPEHQDYPVTGLVLFQIN